MTDIGMLFQRDPLQLSDQDIDELIAYYRSKRTAFVLGDKSAGATKKINGGKKITDVNDILSGL